MRKAMKTARTEGGMTLLELLIALALGATLIAGVLAIWAQTQLAYLYGAEAADAQQNLRVALDRVSQVLRSAGANPAQIPDFVAFGQAGDEFLRAFADLEGDAEGSPPDGELDDPWEDVRFDYANGVLKQQNGRSPSQSLAFGIVPNPGGVPIFQYFDESGLPIASGGKCGMSSADLNRIRRIVVTLTARGVVEGQSVTRTLRSEVRPRNLR